MEFHYHYNLTNKFKSHYILLIKTQFKIGTATVRLTQCFHDHFFTVETSFMIRYHQITGKLSHTLNNKNDLMHVPYNKITYSMCLIIRANSYS